MPQGKTLPEFRFGRVGIAKPGMFVRVVGGGAIYCGRKKDAKRKVYAHRGVFLVQRIFTYRRRTFLEADLIIGQAVSGRYNLLVAGPVFKLPDLPSWRVHPHKLQRVLKMDILKHVK